MVLTTTRSSSEGEAMLRQLVTVVSCFWFPVRIYDGGVSIFVSNATSRTRTTLHRYWDTRVGHRSAGTQGTPMDSTTTSSDVQEHSPKQSRHVLPSSTHSCNGRHGAEASQVFLRKLIILGFKTFRDRYTYVHSL